MKSKKKYIVFASLVLALSAAVYINWQLSGAKTPQSAKELGAASYVSATASASDDEVQQTAALSNESKSYFSSESKSYFSSERTKRQATQDKIIDDAKEIFNLESSSDADKSEAEKNVEELLKTFTIQDSIESIVKAKGFSECLCYISDQGVSVIVPKSQLDDTSVLIIDDAVVTHYEVDYDDISVIGA